MPQPLMSAPRLVVYVLFSSGFFGRPLFSLLPFFLSFSSDAEWLSFPFCFFFLRLFFCSPPSIQRCVLCLLLRARRQNLKKPPFPPSPPRPVGYQPSLGILLPLSSSLPRMQGCLWLLLAETGWWDGWSARSVRKAQKRRGRDKISRDAFKNT